MNREAVVKTLRDAIASENHLVERHEFYAGRRQAMEFVLSLIEDDSITDFDKRTDKETPPRTRR